MHILTKQSHGGARHIARPKGVYMRESSRLQINRIVARQSASERLEKINK